MRKVAIPAALLSTIGVAVTAFLTGLAAHELFDLDWPEAILLGGVVASTDAAAVFATMRFTHIRRRLARTLEGETGLNDPTAIALTIGLIEWIDDPTFRVDDLLFLMVKQLGIGLIIGVLLGVVAIEGVRQPPGVGRIVRPGRLGLGRGALVRRRRRPRRQRLPRRLPRRPGRRQHPVAASRPPRARSTRGSRSWPR